MKSIKGLKSAGALALALIVGTSMSWATTPPLKGGNPNPGIAPPNSQPLGSSYNDWVVLALQWYYSIPTTEANPPTRVFGNMVMPPIAYFTGVTVPVTMKVGQWFLVPILMNVWANTPGDWGYDHPWTEPYGGFPTYEAWARELMKEYNDTLHPTSTIDGKPVQNVDMYRMQTTLFDLAVPEDNAWDSSTYNLPAGTYGPCFGDGWFVILNPMTPGKHTATQVLGGQFVTYEITVTTGK